MGKNNFTSYADVMNRLEMLEKKCEELRKENASLRIAQNLRQPRNLFRDIANQDKAKELFGIAAIAGKVQRDDTNLKQNFETFYKNVFKILNPNYYYNEKKKSETITYTATSSLTDEEYQIYVETLEAVIDVIYYAQKKMKGENNEFTNT